ncbi:MAG: DNA repair protein RadA [Oscillospiraceae bacterium]|nr:DNA repair protein RadA [Oscillospiraceae bacterium]
MKEKLKTIYVCTNCGETSIRWMGRCLSCGEWNTLVEDVVKEPSKNKVSAGAARAATTTTSLVATRLKDVSASDAESRIVTGIGELDRVLGGGIVIGSVVLLGGEPGAGKSTLLLQICAQIQDKVDVLYITGEESLRQIKLRALRLKVSGDSIHLAAENDIEEICGLIQATKPGLVVIDSIQTMNCAELSSSTGSVSQVKECTARLIEVGKRLEIPILIVGHVNKDGAIAGPKVMEHLVDTVLYFEGDKMLPYRVLRGAKNRYGSTSEIGMFDMTGSGLTEIVNPSKQLLEGRPLGVSGNCVACTMEGTRPILSEIQALVTKTSFGTPRRTCSGFDFNRANLLFAVLEKRAGYFLGNLDIYINIVGGLRLDETACDLAVALAVISSLLDKPVPDDTLAVGEIGLGGEIRSVNNLDARIREAARIGFKHIIVPKPSLAQINVKEYPEIEIIGVNYIKEAAQVI